MTNSKIKTNTPSKKKAANIQVDKLHIFEGHPFKVLDDEDMNNLTESIKVQGIISPLIVRTIERTDEYEVISGHRRLHAAVKAGLSEVPALIYPLDRNEAMIAVVDSNLHRERLLPSEKAFAYKMKMDAMKAQGRRTRQYTGCAVNFKSTTVSYKVHKRIQHSEEDYQIIPNMQETIISEEQWLRVQELRKHKRRPTKTGRTSLFSGLLYCYDCKSKMHFVAAKSMKRKQEHFRCSQYKSGRGECAMHYIRDIVLEQLVLEAVSDLSDFVRCYEPVFLYLLAKKNNAMRQKEYQQLQQAVENGTKRIAEIDRLIEKVFEQNAGSVLSDERFAKMLQSYKKEQKSLTQEVEENRHTLQNAEQRVMDLRLVLRTLREITDIKELTPTLVNSLIERIEVHNSNKSSGHSHVKVDIYFTAVGIIDIPT